jgi:ADP-ribosylation factor-like protein 2
MGLLGLLEAVRVRKKAIQVKFFGLNGAGKTTIARRLQRIDTKTVEPSHGFEIAAIDLREYHYDIWDIAGGPEDRAFWPNYVTPMDTLVWVVDSSDRSRLEESRAAFFELMRTVDEKNLRAAVVIGCNPHDPRNALSVEEISELFKLESTRKWTCDVFNVRHTKTMLACLDWIRDDFKWRFNIEEEGAT